MAPEGDLLRLGIGELFLMINYTFKPHLSFPRPRSAILGILDLGLPLLLASVSKLAQQRLCRGYRVSQAERERGREARTNTEMD